MTYTPSKYITYGEGKYSSPQSGYFPMVSAGLITYSTGTISISSGTLTGVGTAFTSQMVGGTITINSGGDINGTYYVNYYTSGTSLNVSPITGGGTVGTGNTFSLVYYAGSTVLNPTLSLAYTNPSTALVDTSHNIFLTRFYAQENITVSSLSAVLYAMGTVPPTWIDLGIFDANGYLLGNTGTTGSTAAFLSYSYTTVAGTSGATSITIASGSLHSPQDVYPGYIITASNGAVPAATYVTSVSTWSGTVTLGLSAALTATITSGTHTVKFTNPSLSSNLGANANSLSTDGQYSNNAGSTPVTSVNLKAGSTYYLAIMCDGSPSVVVSGGGGGGDIYEDPTAGTQITSNIGSNWLHGVIPYTGSYYYTTVTPAVTNSSTIVIPNVSTGFPNGNTKCLRSYGSGDSTNAMYIVGGGGAFVQNISIGASTTTLTLSTTVTFSNNTATNIRARLIPDGSFPNGLAMVTYKNGIAGTGPGPNAEGNYYSTKFISFGNWVNNNLTPLTAAPFIKIN